MQELDDDMIDDVDKGGLLEAMAKARSIGTMEVWWLTAIKTEAKELARELETEKARLPYPALQSLKRLRKLLKEGPG